MPERRKVESRKKLSRAEEYGESVLRTMKKKPGDCNLFEELFPQITDNPLIVYGGEAGGSISLALAYLKKLNNIHKPLCEQKVSHIINIL